MSFEQRDRHHESERRLRVLALPACNRRALNPFQALLYHAVRRHDVDGMLEPAATSAHSPERPPFDDERRT